MLIGRVCHCARVERLSRFASNRRRNIPNSKFLLRRHRVGRRTAQGKRLPTSKCAATCIGARMCWYSGDAGLQMAVFSASGTHVPKRTLRAGSRKPPFSARPDLNPITPLVRSSDSFPARTLARGLCPLYIRHAVCASRQERHIPGALSISRELSLGRPVGFLIRRPPTL